MLSSIVHQSGGAEVAASNLGFALVPFTATDFGVALLSYV